MDEGRQGKVGETEVGRSRKGSGKAEGQGESSLARTSHLIGSARHCSTATANASAFRQNLAAGAQGKARRTHQHFGRTAVEAQGKALPPHGGRAESEMAAAHQGKAGCLWPYTSACQRERERESSPAHLLRVAPRDGLVVRRPDPRHSALGFGPYNCRLPKGVPCNCRLP